MERWKPVFSHQYDPVMAGSIDGTGDEAHDHGIIRALEHKYKPNKSVKGLPPCCLFVGRLNASTTEETLRRIFSHYGDIKHLRLVQDLVTGFSKCYAFIEYVDELGAHLAWTKTNKLQIDGNAIFVDYELERKLVGWVPRRLGGGIGGRKESGQLRFGGRDRPFSEPIIVPQKSRTVWNTHERADQSPLGNQNRTEWHRDSHGVERKGSRSIEKLNRNREIDDKYTKYNRNQISGRNHRNGRDRSKSHERQRRSKGQSGRYRSRSRSQSHSRSRSRERSSRSGYTKYKKREGRTGRY